MRDFHTITYSYLSGTKRYKVGAEFGFETLTLDMDGSDVTKTAPFDHVTRHGVETVVLSEFTGTIVQVPPIFSAIRQNGTKLYELARRQGKTVDDVDIPARQVQVDSIELLSFDLPKFELNVQCGGGTYIRSLIRDIALELNTVATVTSLQRTQQGQFTLDDCLVKEDWTVDNIYAAVERTNAKRKTETDNNKKEVLHSEEEEDDDDEGHFTLEDLVKEDWTADNMYAAVDRTNAERETETDNKKEVIHSEEEDGEA